MKARNGKVARIPLEIREQLNCRLADGEPGIRLVEWLNANPDVRVQVKAQKFAARARTANAEERAALWPKMVEIYAPYALYQTKTDRQIPVVILQPVSNPPTR